MLPEESIWSETLIGLERQNWTLGKLLEEKAQRNHGKVFLLFGNEEINYEQINEMANRIANGLIEKRLKKGSKIAVMLSNCPEFIYVWFGIAKMGGIMIPINTSWRGELLEYVLSHSDAEMIIVEDSLLPQVKEVSKNISQLRKFFVRSEKGVGSSKSDSIQELYHSSAEEPIVALTPQDPYEIMYTSGTTGRSKGVVRWSEYVILRGLRTVRYMDYTSKDILYTCLPLFHGNAQNLSVIPALLSNARLALGKKFSASKFWIEIRNYKATVFNFVGTMISILHKQEPAPEDALSGIRLARGGGIPSQIWKDFENRFNLTLVETYGSTEGGSVWNMPGGRIGSIGKPPYFNEARIVDEEDKELPFGKIGELIIRPRDPNEKWVEYYKDPEATREKYLGGWLRTGDFAYQDEDGWMFFVGRKKDVIRRRGENISALEVEIVINSHPKVLECACFGFPSELGEEDVMTCIVLKPGMTMGPDEVISFCKERMAYFMIPRYIDFINSLPKTPTERVEKYKLKDMYVCNNTAWDREVVEDMVSHGS